VTRSLFGATMSGLTRRMHRVFQSRKVRLHALLEQRLHVGLQTRLVALESQHVMPLLRANLLGDLPLAT
jgi:hypothetical protein